MTAGKTGAQPATQGQGAATNDVAFELATGLSVADVEALQTSASDEIRARIAVKFARQFDRLCSGKVRSLTTDILELFSIDKAKLVRLRFAEGIKASRHLPPRVAARLARDEIDVAWPILEASPVLTAEEIEKIIETMPEPYAFAIAGRRPLGEGTSELLVELRGTQRVVCRLIDNDEAMLSMATLGALQQWADTDLDIARRLVRRPNLPFELIEQHVERLAERLDWQMLATRRMSSVEAVRLQTLIAGSARLRQPSGGQRFDRLRRHLRDRFTAGELVPADILRFLKAGDLDGVECGLAVLADIDPKRARNLLHGGDRRGFVALCLGAGFPTADYLAFRMALALAESGNAAGRPALSYEEGTLKYAKEQFEQMRARPAEVDRWLQRERAGAAAR